ncbi:MAG TPA: sigma-70 family RNA polymerase sigma factor, partial [Micromonosporaceae bacterium]|nr:sigma-70 family RNA polymerase sigma factor [Micromonosporaceae bacterium]
MRDDPTVVDLVIAARKGDRDAWNRIVARYAPLIWTICRRFQLSRSDVDDVGQTVWLTLVEHLDTIREPAALPGWLATTTRNECLKVVRAGQRRQHGEQALDAEPAVRDDLAELELE